MLCFPFNIQHSTFPSRRRRIRRFHFFNAFRRRIKGHDDQSLIILRRAVPRELPDRSQQRFLDVFRGKMAGIEKHSLEAIEAERLSIIIDRFDQAIAVENQAIAGGEFDEVLAKWIAPPYAERETPRRKRLEAAIPGAINIWIEMAGR